MQLLLIFFLFCCFDTIAQSSTSKWNIEAGVAFRTNPFTLEDKTITQGKGVEFNSIKHFKHQDLSISLRKALHHKISAEFSSYFRYGHNHYERQPDFSKKDVRKLKMDYFLDILYGLKNKRDFSFLVGVGYGFMNVNSRYDFDQTIAIDPSGLPVTVPVKGTFRFSAPALLFRANFGRISTGVTIYGTPDDNYEAYVTLWPELKIGFSLAK